MNPVEAIMGRRNTEALIDVEPIWVSLRRPVRTKTEAGGFIDTGPASLPLQKVRILPLAGYVWDRSIRTPDEGNVPDVTHQLLGDFNLNIEKEDEFDYPGPPAGRYKVIHVSPIHNLRTQALLRYMEN